MDHLGMFIVCCVKKHQDCVMRLQLELQKSFRLGSDLMSFFTVVFQLGSKEVVDRIICLHKGRRKTVKSDSTGAKEWGNGRQRRGELGWSQDEGGGGGAECKSGQIKRQTRWDSNVKKKLLKDGQTLLLGNSCVSCVPPSPWVDMTTFPLTIALSKGL